QALVMAGGGGTRLWPLSRTDRPKQLLRLLGDRSLFQMALDRLQPWLPVDHIHVAAPADLVPALRAQAPSLASEAFLVEPSPKGTAAVIALAALQLSRTHPESVMLCLTADHHIGNPDRLRALLEAAVDVAETGSLVTLGIPATSPDTGYGYIERGESIGVFRGVEAFRARAFKEKPNLELAEKYVGDGLHTWNSGMFVWRVDRVLEAFRRWMPDLASILSEIEPALGTPSESEVLESVWPRIRPETIDFGLMERADNVAVLPATDLMWADIGSWDRLHELRHPDADGNVLETRAWLAIDSKRSMVLARDREERQKPKLVALLGVEDLVIVDTHDALLVCRRDRAADVRLLVDRLRELGMDTYLVWEP
ncbi:MAG TPA: sugar phosphate nucleotidyltransferase, partial [Anaerolineales bacterium]|nr:sugar phosphate nucleotidyltransferase [Anaerolineales bacterium]